MKMAATARRRLGATSCAPSRMSCAPSQTPVAPSRMSVAPSRMSRSCVARAVVPTPLLALLVLAACRTANPAEPPAYVVRPTRESRLALTQAVGTALSDPRVTIDDDALTGSGVLNIERTQRPDPKRLVIEGRDPGDPRGVAERFHLVKIGEHCVLIHDRTDRHFELVDTECERR